MQLVSQQAQISRKSTRGRVQSCICCIGQRSSTTVDADSDTANQVAASHSKTSPEERESGVVGLGIKDGGFINVSDLGGEDDGHDDSVNGDDLAEDDGDQVLCSNSRRLDTSTENR